MIKKKKKKTAFGAVSSHPDFSSPTLFNVIKISIETFEFLLSTFVVFHLKKYFLGMSSHFYIISFPLI